MSKLLSNFKNISGVWHINSKPKGKAFTDGTMLFAWYVRCGYLFVCVMLSNVFYIVICHRLIVTVWLDVKPRSISRNYYCFVSRSPTLMKIVLLLIRQHIVLLASSYIWNQCRLDWNIKSGFRNQRTHVCTWDGVPFQCLMIDDCHIYRVCMTRHIAQM